MLEVRYNCASQGGVPVFLILVHVIEQISVPVHIDNCALCKFNFRSASYFVLPYIWDIFGNLEGL